MSLATGLRLGFAAALALVVAACAGVWWIAAQFEESAQELRASVTAMEALARAESGLWQLRYGFPQFMVGDAEARARILADQSAQYAIVEDNLARYSAVASAGEESRMLTELRAQYLRYKDARPKFFELYGAGRIDDAVAWRALTTTPYGAITVNAFDRQIALARADVEADARYALRQSAAARVGATAVSAALVMLVVASFWAAQRALAPVRELRDRVQAMVREHSAEADEGLVPANEIDALVESFTRMSQRLQAHTGLLRTSNERLDYLLGATPAVIFAGSMAGEHALTYISPNVHAVFGYAATKFVDNSSLLEELIHPEDRERVRTEIPCLVPGGLQVSDFRLLHADGSWRWARAVRSLKCDASGRPVERVGYLIDVTELKRAELMKHEFISTVSHELRTPLTSIRGSLGLIAGEVAGALPPAVHKLVAIAAGNCERLIGLVNDLLDAEKMASGRFTLQVAPSDIGTLLERVVASNEGFAHEHQVGLRLLPCREPLQANVDAERLHQAVTNLVSNAIKFSPADKSVEIGLLRRGGHARIEVRDRGPGVPEEFRSRIFQKFSQADGSDARRIGGSGLGLAITRELVERMGGTVGYDSIAGEGSTFFIELPVTESTAPMGATSP